MLPHYRGKRLTIVRSHHRGQTRSQCRHRASSAGDCQVL